MPFFPRSSSKRSARRRRGDGPDARPLAFDVETVEFVPAGDDLGLLRLTGCWSAPLERVVPAPIELEIERDGEPVRIEPLPDPTAGPAIAGPHGEPWRAAFMAPVELAED